MLGHMSGAYAARVSRDLSLASRFDFNMYSYESEWTMGAEWWLRRAPSNDVDEGMEPIPSLVSDPTNTNTTNDVIGVVKARASTSQVRFPVFHYPFQTLKTCYSERISHVGGPTAEHARQPWRCVRLFQSQQTNKSYWPRVILL